MVVSGASFYAEHLELLFFFLLKIKCRKFGKTLSDHQFPLKFPINNILGVLYPLPLQQLIIIIIINIIIPREFFHISVGVCVTTSLLKSPRLFW